MDYKKRSAARRATPYLNIVRFDLPLGEFQRPQGWDSRTLTARRQPSAKLHTCHYMIGLCEM
ncbi:hypothetical protein M407DRAFT_245455 [Tulasnella calospora MUT 4182]|uniref:Uncharacterized protein n=1 Tax=Tulasnella calospora MUT 4182 TaxID=1051891 RepID=A0A0C3KJ29_9AGAM|nr:hypothetical protein M407DRAFT_245455 [Tulasnella calospora MUT 4182]